MLDKTEESRIRTVIEEWADALRRKDAAGVLSYGADGLVHYSLAPPLVTDQGEQGLQAWFDTWKGPIGYEFRDLEINASGDVAYCTCLNRMSGTKTSGETADLWFRQTIGLRKIGGTWKIAHLHESVPFYMNGSFKAAVDLKP